MLEQAKKSITPFCNDKRYIISFKAIGEENCKVLDYYFGDKELCKGDTNEKRKEILKQYYTHKYSDQADLKF